MVTPAAGRGTALRLPGVPAPGGVHPLLHLTNQEPGGGVPEPIPLPPMGGPVGAGAQPSLSSGSHWKILELPWKALAFLPVRPPFLPALPKPGPASLSPSPVPCPQPTAGDGDTPPSLATTSLSPASTKDPHPIHHLVVPKPRPTSPALTQGPPSSSPPLPAGATKPDPPNATAVTLCPPGAGDTRTRQAAISTRTFNCSQGTPTPPKPPPPPALRCRHRRHRRPLAAAGVLAVTSSHRRPGDTAPRSGDTGDGGSRSSRGCSSTVGTAPGISCTWEKSLR